MAEDIGLTDTQLAQIEAIVDAQLPAIHELMDQARTAAETFRSNHGPGDFDETEYRAFFESQDKIHLEAKLLGARAVAQVWDVLNADQQQQVLDKLDAMGPGQGNGKRFGGGRRFGRR
jgi:Spy/CpxP family protein refolding chaperone